MKCSYCNETINDGSLACFKCERAIEGVKIKENFSNNNTNNNSSIIGQSSIKQLSNEIIQQYIDLVNQINNNKDIAEDLKINRKQLELLKSNLNENYEKREKLNLIVEKEKRDIDNLKNSTISTLIAKMRGNLESKVNKEEEEYVIVFNKLVSLDTECSSIRKNINDLKNLIDEQEKTKRQFENNKEIFSKLIQQITQGISDPTANKIEREIKNLEEKLTPTINSLRLHYQSLNNVQTAYSLVKKAHLEIRKSNSWLAIVSDDLLYTNKEISSFSETRDNITNARFYLKVALNLTPNIGIESILLEISVFWDNFIKNIFLRYSLIKDSNQAIDSNLVAIDEVISLIKSKILVLEEKKKELDIPLNKLKNELFITRKKIIEGAINLQK